MHTKETASYLLLLVLLLPIAAVAVSFNVPQAHAWSHEMKIKSLTNWSSSIWSVIAVGPPYCNWDGYGCPVPPSNNGFTNYAARGSYYTEDNGLTLVHDFDGGDDGGKQYARSVWATLRMEGLVDCSMGGHGSPPFSDCNACGSGRVYQITVDGVSVPDCKCNVGSGSTDNAQMVSNDIPTSMTTGQQYTVHVTVKNTGTTTWTYAAGYKLGALGDSDPLYTTNNRVFLNSGESIAPNGQKVFTFIMTGPAVGTYTTDWEMIKEGVHWFGDNISKSVQVTGGSTGCSPKGWGSGQWPTNQWTAVYYDYTGDLSNPACPTAIGVTGEPSYSFDWNSVVVSGKSTNFFVVVGGNWYFPVTQLYYFTLGSDDGGLLYFGGDRSSGSVIINRWSSGGYGESTGSAYMSAGYHQITMYFFQTTGSSRFTFNWGHIYIGSFICTGITSSSLTPYSDSSGTYNKYAVVAKQTTAASSCQVTVMNSYGYSWVGQWSASGSVPPTVQSGWWFIGPYSYQQFTITEWTGNDLSTGYADLKKTQGTDQQWVTVSFTMHAPGPRSILFSAVTRSGTNLATSCQGITFLDVAGSQGGSVTVSLTVGSSYYANGRQSVVCNGVTYTFVEWDRGGYSSSTYQVTTSLNWNGYVREAPGPYTGLDFGDVNYAIYQQQQQPQYAVCTYVNPSSIGGSFTMTYNGNTITATNGGRYLITTGVYYNLHANSVSGYSFGSWSTDRSVTVSNTAAADTQVSFGTSGWDGNCVGGLSLNYGSPETITFQLSGVGSDASGAVITIDGTGYTYSQFPKQFSWSSGSTHSVSASDPVLGSTGKRYHFLSWNNGDGLSSASGTYTTPTSNQVVTAYYGAQYYLTVQTNPTGRDSPTGAGWYNSGDTAYFSVTSPTSGGTGIQYVCTGYVGDASGAGSSGSIYMDGPKTITFNWKTQYLLTMQVSPANSGSTDPTVGSYWYDAATPVWIDAWSTSGNTFQSWTGSGSGSTSGTTAHYQITLNAAITQTANFVVPPYTYQVCVDGLDTGVTTRLYRGTLTATLSNGQCYLYPSLTGSNTFSVDTTTTTGALTDTQFIAVTYTHTVTNGLDSPYYFHYTKQYRLTMSVTPTGSGTTSPAVGTSWQTAGASVPITATAGSGYALSSWSSTSNGGYTGSINPSSVTMYGPITEQAQFGSGCNYAITPNPGSVTLWPSKSATTSVLVTMTGVSCTAISLTMSGWGGATGLSSAFSPSSGTPTYQSTLTITANASPAYGTFTATIQGSGGSIAAKTASLTIIVNQAYSYTVTVSGLDSGVTTRAYQDGAQKCVLSNAQQCVLTGLTGTPTLSVDQFTSTGAPTDTRDHAATFSITVSSSQGSPYTFQYHTEYKLTTSVSPSGGGSVTVAGPTGTGETCSGSSGTTTTYWCNGAGTVTLTANPAASYVFASWTGTGTGAYNGATNPTSITMSAPTTEQATFSVGTCDYTLDATPSSLSVGTGGSSDTTVSVTLTGSTCNTVTLSVSSWGSSTGLSSGFSKSSGTPTYSSTMTISATSSASTGSFTITLQGAGTNVPTRTKQLQVTVTSGTYSYTITVAGLDSGVSTRAYVDTTPQTSITLPAGSPPSYTYTFTGLTGTRTITVDQVTSTGAPAGTRFHATVYSKLVSATGTYTFTYHKEYQLTTNVSPSGGGTVAVAGPTGIGETCSGSSGTTATYWCNSAGTLTLTASPLGQGYTLSAWTGTGSGSYSGTNNPATATMNAQLTETATFGGGSNTMTVSYSINGACSGYGAPVFHYIQGGVSKQATLNTTANTLAVDTGSAWSVAPNPLDGSGQTEQCYADPSTMSGTSSGQTMIFTFYQEYAQTLSYMITGGGTGYTAPSFISKRYGLAASDTLTTTPTRYWYDVGAAWSVSQNPLSGSTNSERWYTYQATSGTLTSAQSMIFTFQHQYDLTMLVDPVGAGTTTPLTSWQNSTATVSITGVPGSGHDLASWTGFGPGSYTGAANPANVTMNGAITETAHFGGSNFDYLLFPSPQVQDIEPGESADFTITVLFLSGTAQSVTLTTAGLPSGATLHFDQTSGTPTYSATMTVSTTGAVGLGKYPLNVTGTSGGVTRSTQMLLQVDANIGPDFTIRATPAAAKTNPGTTVPATLYATFLRGYSSTVTLTASSLPDGVTVSFNPQSGTSTFNSTVAITVGSDVEAGRYLIELRGTGADGKSHSTLFLLIVNYTFATPSFDINVDPTMIVSAIPDAGTTSGYVTATITPVNGFTGTVTITATGAPNGVATSANPSTTPVPPSETSIITMTISREAPQGEHTLRATGKSGSIQRIAEFALLLYVSQEVQVTITQPTDCSTPGCAVSGTGVEIDANITDTIYGPATVNNATYRIEGQGYDSGWHNMQRTSEWNWQAFWDSTQASMSLSGPYTLTVRGFSSWNNTQAMGDDQISVMVDNRQFQMPETYYINFAKDPKGTWDPNGWYPDNHFLPGEEMGIHYATDCTGVVYAYLETSQGQNATTGLVEPRLKTQYPWLQQKYPSGGYVIAVFPFAGVGSPTPAYGNYRVRLSCLMGGVLTPIATLPFSVQGLDASWKVMNSADKAKVMAQLSFSDGSRVLGRGGTISASSTILQPKTNVGGYVDDTGMITIRVPYYSWEGSLIFKVMYGGSAFPILGANGQPVSHTIPYVALGSQWTTIGTDYTETVNIKVFKKSTGVPVDSFVLLQVVGENPKTQFWWTGKETKSDVATFIIPIYAATNRNPPSSFSIYAWIYSLDETTIYANQFSNLRIVKETIAVMPTITSASNQGGKFVIQGTLASASSTMTMKNVQVTIEVRDSNGHQVVATSLAPGSIKPGTANGLANVFTASFTSNLPPGTYTIRITVKDLTTGRTMGTLTTTIKI